LHCVPRWYHIPRRLYLPGCLPVPGTHWLLPQHLLPCGAYLHLRNSLRRPPRLL
jgi:hypothetical protein